MPGTEERPNGSGVGSVMRGLQQQSSSFWGDLWKGLVCGALLPYHRLFVNNLNWLRLGYFLIWGCNCKSPRINSSQPCKGQGPTGR